MSTFSSPFLSPPILPTSRTSPSPLNSRTRSSLPPLPTHSWTPSAGCLLSSLPPSLPPFPSPSLSPSPFPSLSAQTLSSSRQRSFPLRAKRRESSSAVKEDAEQLDEDLRTGLNEVANEALRVMLSDDIQRLSEFKRKVDFYGEFLVGENELEAARFMLVIKGLLEHEVIVEHEDLNGAYKKAFEKIWSLLEDSGWLLKMPGQEESDAMEMADDELIPPVLRTPY